MTSLFVKTFPDLCIVNLKSSCKIYLEYSKYNDLEIPKEFNVIKQKDVGDVKALLLMKDEN